MSCPRVLSEFNWNSSRRFVVQAARVACRQWALRTSLRTTVVSLAADLGNMRRLVRGLTAAVSKPVGGLLPGSLFWAAAQAGIRPGDVITSVAGKEVTRVSELLSTVASLKPGTATRFSLQRQNQKLELEVTPGVRPAPRKAAQ